MRDQAQDWFGNAELGSSSIGDNFFGQAATDFVFQQSFNNIYGAVHPMQKQYSSYVDVLKGYFNVSNVYVLQKMKCILFPFLNRDWDRDQKDDIFQDRNSDPFNAFQTASDDLQEVKQRNMNDPDLYIPSMSFVSYILLFGVILGHSNKFTPQLMGSKALNSLIIWVVESILFKLGAYMFSAPLTFLDILSYTGYKFCGVLISVIGSIFLNNYLFYPLLGYLCFMDVFFLLKSIGRVVETGSNSLEQQDISSRNWFVLALCVIQLPIMLLLVLYL